MPFIKRIQSYLIDWFSMTVCLPIIALIMELIYFSCFEIPRNDFILTAGGLPLTLLILFICVLIIVCMNVLKPKKEQGFEKVKDLIRGTITVDKIEHIKDAYDHFKKTPGI